MPKQIEKDISKAFVQPQTRVLAEDIQSAQRIAREMKLVGIEAMMTAVLACMVAGQPADVNLKAHAWKLIDEVQPMLEQIVQQAKRGGE